MLLNHTMRFLLLSCCIFALLLEARAVSIPTQLRRTSVCNSLGFTSKNLTQYQVVVPLRTPSSGVLGFLPVYSSLPLGSLTSVQASRIETAVIFVHGLGADANQYFCTAMNASSYSAKPSSVLTIAPWFGNQQVAAANWQQGSKMRQGSLYWSGSALNSWMTGAAGSVTSQGNAVSRHAVLTSFGAMDMLISMLQNMALLPNLKLITLAGFSAGGQFTQRYAWAATKGLPSPSGNSNLPVVRFIVSDPDTYLYLSTNRPDPSCVPPRDTGGNWSCNSYKVPNASLVSRCTNWNTWKYGTTMPPSGSAGPYLNAITNVTARSAAYVTKQVAVLLGQNDVCDCQFKGFVNNPSVCLNSNFSCTCSSTLSYATCTPNCCDTYPDSLSTNNLEITCEAMMQGSNRLQRGLNFVNYLQRTFPGAAPVYSVIPGMGHDSAKLMSSIAYMTYAYNVSSMSWPGR